MPFTQSDWALSFSITSHERSVLPSLTKITSNENPLAVPFIGYHYVKMYRDKICGGSIQFSHAVLFTIFMYMFASLLVAVAHYAYFQFIDHGFIVNSYIQLWDELMANTPALIENKEVIKETIDTARSLTSINITMQLLSWDVFWGSILAIPTALMVMKKDKSRQVR